LAGLSQPGTVRSRTVKSNLSGLPYSWRGALTVWAAAKVWLSEHGIAVARDDAGATAALRASPAAARTAATSGCAHQTGRGFSSD